MATPQPEFHHHDDVDAVDAATDPSAALICIADFGRRAATILPPAIRGYYNSGATNELTLRDNCAAYSRLHIRPRFLRDVSQRSTRSVLLGHSLSMPIAVAPTAMQRMAHPLGELATAAAAGRAGTIYVMSTLATASIEEVAAAAPDTCKWFQLYIYKERRLTEELVRRAEAADFRAIVLTVDAPTFGVRRTDMRNRFAMPGHLELRNFAGAAGATMAGASSGSGVEVYVRDQFDASLTWEDVRWLIGFTRLPVIVKGVLTAEDARLAVQNGCSGVIVSNHGARQVDTVQASIDALPAIVEAVGKSITVMMDGGIRDGTDVFKALALGAQCVFVGRPILWGLAVDGQRGVERVLSILHEEFERTMILSGIVSTDQISGEYVGRDAHLSKL